MCCPLGSSSLRMHANFFDDPQNGLDFICNQSVHAQGRQGVSEPRAATALAGMNGGARGGDGARKRRNDGGSDHAQVTQDPNQ